MNDTTTIEHRTEEKRIKLKKQISNCVFLKMSTFSILHSNRLRSTLFGYASNEYAAHINFSLYSSLFFSSDKPIDA